MAETEVDAPVEDQTDQALAAIAIVVAEMIAAQGSDADDNTPLVVAWLPALQSTAGVVLLQYLLRTTEAFTTAAGVPKGRMGPRIREVASKATERATERALEVLAATVPELAALPPVERTVQTRIDAGKVARAMVVGAKEETRWEVAHDLGAVYKVWRTRQDTKVRSTHGGLEGNKIPLANSFVTHDLNEIRFPHDPMAPLSETAGCRCRLSYLVPVKENA